MCSVSDAGGRVVSQLWLKLSAKLPFPTTSVRPPMGLISVGLWSSLYLIGSAWGE